MGWGELAFRAYLSVVGGALVAGAATTLVTRVRLWRTGVRVTGRVVGWSAQYDTDGTVDGWTPRVRFTAADGTEHELQGAVAGWTRRDDRLTGQPFPVIHDPLKPAKALPGQAWRFWIAPPALLLFGGAVLWIAVFRV